MTNILGGDSDFKAKLRTIDSFLQKGYRVEFIQATAISGDTPKNLVYFSFRLVDKEANFFNCKTEVSKRFADRLFELFKKNEFKGCYSVISADLGNLTI